MFFASFVVTSIAIIFKITVNAKKKNFNCNRATIRVYDLNLNIYWILIAIGIRNRILFEKR